MQHTGVHLDPSPGVQMNTDFGISCITARSLAGQATTKCDVCDYLETKQPKDSRRSNWKTCGAPGPAMPLRATGTASLRKPFLQSVRPENRPKRKANKENELQCATNKQIAALPSKTPITRLVHQDNMSTRFVRSFQASLHPRPDVGRKVIRRDSVFGLPN